MNYKKILGAVLIVIGFLALVTPFTPGSWLIFVGASLMGFRWLFRERATRLWRKLKSWFKRG